MKRASAGREDQSVEINMTPMIDCVFQLILFFLVTMRYPLIERNMPANLPKQQEGIGEESDKKDDTVRYLVRLSYDDSEDPDAKQKLRTAIAEFKEAESRVAGAVTMAERDQWQATADALLASIPRPSIRAQGAPVRSFGDLDSQLLLVGRAAGDKKVQIVIDAAREVPFMFVTRVQEICSRRKFTDISFAAKPKEA